MFCNRVKRKLSAYLDGELKERENKIISEHLGKCPDCKKDFIALSQQDMFITQLETIEPSAGFKSQFWKKVADNESVIARPDENRGVTILTRLLLPLSGIAMTKKATWLPIPAMCFLLLLIIFHLFSFSFAVSVKGQDVKNQIISCALKNIVTHSKPLNHVSLLNFCKSCCETLCKCAQSQKVSSKCICGRCKNR